MNISEDSFIVSRDRTRSIKHCRDSLPIPVDLVIEIFSRLPAKSVARYRYLSKFWDNLFRSQYFIDLFAAKSSLQPQILFAYRNESDYSFFSAHQPSENSSDDISPTHLNNLPVSGSNPYDLGLPINGLVCLNKYIGDRRSVQVIYNLSTGEFLNLPEVKTRWTDEPAIIPFLGYDPTAKQLKVLSVVCYDTPWVLPDGEIDNICLEYQVLTLETEQLSWRVIECCKPHFAMFPQSRICINGVLYYLAIDASNVQVIVCFDVRSETFRFMKVMETFNKNLGRATRFTNCNGKLGVLIPEESNNHFMTRESVSFELWVLKDAQKHEWSNHVYVLPSAWMNVVGETKLRFVGMIGTNEIVLSSYYNGDELRVPLYIFYYNTEKNTIRRLTVQGLEASTLEPFYIFLNHVENVSLFKLPS